MIDAIDEVVTWESWERLRAEQTQLREELTRMRLLYAQATDALAHANKAAAEAADDSARLDRLQSIARCEPKMDGNHVWSIKLAGLSLRDAIDAKPDHPENRLEMVPEAAVPDAVADVIRDVEQHIQQGVASESAAPQPAVSARGPLTDERARQLMNKVIAEYGDGVSLMGLLKSVVRETERAHGIEQPKEPR